MDFLLLLMRGNHPHSRHELVLVLLLLPLPLPPSASEMPQTCGQKTEHV